MGGKTGIRKRLEETLGIIDKFVILTMVMTSKINTFVKTDQIIHFKYYAVLLHFTSMKLWKKIRDKFWKKKPTHIKNWLPSIFNTKWDKTTQSWYKKSFMIHSLAGFWPSFPSLELSSTSYVPLFALVRLNCSYLPWRLSAPASLSAGRMQKRFSHIGFFSLPLQCWSSHNLWEGGRNHGNLFNQTTIW